MTIRPALRLVVTVALLAGVARSALSATSPIQACDDKVLSLDERSELKTEILRALNESDAAFFERTSVYASVGKLRATEKDAVVFLSSADYCGSAGCTAMVLAQRPKGPNKRMSYVAIGKILPARLPIVALPTAHKGWRDLGVFVAGGGSVQGHNAKLVFDGRRYPLNPTMQGPLGAYPYSARVLIGPADSSAQECRLQ